VKADGDRVNYLEANTEESSDKAMGEMMWHCRDHFAGSKIGRTKCARRVCARDGAHQTRQQTEKTNIALRLSHGEIPEGLSGSERLACWKRNVENLGGPIGSRRLKVR